MAGDEPEEIPPPPLDESVYMSEEDDTYEKVKRGLKQFGEELKRGGEEFVAGSKNIASKSKEKIDTALEKRKQAKAMKEPLTFPWNTLSVAELKERLRELGLTVSGKKDDLIDRIMQHYRTEIPTREDGTTELIDDLNQIPDVPAAPNLDSLSSSEEELDDEDTNDLQIVKETEIIQSSEDGQLYAHSPLHNEKSLNDWKANRVNSTISMIFGFLIFLFTLSIIDYGFNIGLFRGPMSIFNSLAAERIVSPYGGMDETQEVALTALLALMFFCSSLLYISRKRQIIAALVVMIALLTSFSIRIYMALSVDAFDDIDVLGLLIIDLVLAIPFAFTCWIPAMASSVLNSDDVVSTEFFVVQSDMGTSDEPESITDTSDDDYMGEDVGSFDVSRPIPPRRRQKLSYSIYEVLFLLISLAIWPFTIGMHIVMALGIHIESINYTGDMDSHGLILLLPLYLLCFVPTIAVIRFDREARAGEVYAKEKLAYHRDMDQYLELKKVYYEKSAERIGTTSSNDDA